MVVVVAGPLVVVAAVAAPVVVALIVVVLAEGTPRLVKWHEPPCDDPDEKESPERARADWTRAASTAVLKRMNTERGEEAWACRSNLQACSVVPKASASALRSSARNWASSARSAPSTGTSQSQFD